MICSICGAVLGKYKDKDMLRVSKCSHGHWICDEHKKVKGNSQGHQ